MDFKKLIGTFVLFCCVSHASSLLLHQQISTELLHQQTSAEALKLEKQEGGCKVWKMTSEYYWGCVEFDSEAQFQCHQAWKASVGPPTDYLDQDDIAECGECKKEEGKKYFKWGVDPYLNQTRYFVNLKHPYIKGFFKLARKPFEFKPHMEICSPEGVQSPTAYRKAFLRTFMRCIKMKTIAYPEPEYAQTAIEQCASAADDPTPGGEI